MVYLGMLYFTTSNFQLQERVMKDFLAIADYTQEEIQAILDQAVELKKECHRYFHQ